MAVLESFSRKLWLMIQTRSKAKADQGATPDSGGEELGVYNNEGGDGEKAETGNPSKEIEYKSPEIDPSDESLEEEGDLETGMEARFPDERGGENGDPDEKIPEMTKEGFNNRRMVDFFMFYLLALLDLVHSAVLLYNGSITIKNSEVMDATALELSYTGITFAIFCVPLYVYVLARDSYRLTFDLESEQDWTRTKTLQYSVMLVAQSWITLLASTLILSRLLVLQLDNRCIRVGFFGMMQIILIYLGIFLAVAQAYFCNIEGFHGPVGKFPHLWIGVILTPIIFAISSAQSVSPSSVAVLAVTPMCAYLALYILLPQIPVRVCQGRWSRKQIVRCCDGIVEIIALPAVVYVIYVEMGFEQVCNARLLFPYLVIYLVLCGVFHFISSIFGFEENEENDWKPVG